MPAVAIQLQHPAPLSAADIAVMRGRPGFRAAVEAYCAANLARYHALAPIARWMVSDMGRASLSGTVMVLHAQGRLTAGTLFAAPVVAGGEVSRGRARLYLQRAMANGLIVAAEPAKALTNDTPLQPSAAFAEVMVGVLRPALGAAATLAPEAGPALDRLDDPDFVGRVARHIGAITPSLPQLFPLDSPVQLFQARDGGTRVLEELVLRQRWGRQRLLDACAYSHSALARASRCSRTHVIQLLRDGEAQGYLQRDARRLIVAPELSDDAERYFAHTFAMVRTVAVWALAEG